MLCNSNLRQLEQLNTLIIQSCRVIIGPCLKWNSERLLNKAKLSTIWHMISAQGLIYIHNLKINKLPQAIYELYHIPKRPARKKAKITPEYIPRTKILKNSLFYRFSEYYSGVPEYFKEQKPKKFKKEIKIYVKYNYPPYSFPTNDQTNNTDSN